MKVVISVIVLLVFCVLFMFIRPVKNVDENPIVTLERLIGEYKNVGNTLCIEQGNIYKEIKNEEVVTGTWSVIDSNLTLTSDVNVVSHIKVMDVEGSYQLIYLDSVPQDPDTYDWAKVMTKVNE